VVDVVDNRRSDLALEALTALCGCSSGAMPPILIEKRTQERASNQSES
jgi:hypothetical protein